MLYSMDASRKPGTVYWIDHYTIPVNDVPKSIAFHERVLGVVTMPHSGLPASRGMFQAFSHPDGGIWPTLKQAGCHQGLFIQREPLPPSEELGKGYPRHALFIRPQDIDEHLRRLEANDVIHSEPVPTSAEGEEGTAIYWLDAEGNQFEFWAPRRMPSGAIEGNRPLKVGRISHLAYASRDLSRTADFFSRYCALEPLRSADIPADTLVFGLAAGGRLVFKLTGEPGLRASGRGLYEDLHTALLVRREDFWPNYERMWAELPEGDDDAKGTNLPARTMLHRSPNGFRFKAAFGRGDDWLDWDANLFHFVGGTARGDSMVKYDSYFLDDLMDEYLAQHSAAR